MTTRKLGMLAAALGIAVLILGHEAAGQPTPAPNKDAAPSQASPGPSSPAPPSRAQPAAWQTTTGPDRSFTADMPAEPIYTTKEMRTAAGSGYTMHQYLLEQGEVAYVAQTAVYPAEVNVSNHRTNLQGGLDNAAKNMEGGKWASVGWVTHQGLTAVDAVGARGSHAIRSFSVMKGRQIFTLTYAGPSGSARSPDVDRFIGSLRIGP